MSRDALSASSPCIGSLPPAALAGMLRGPGLLIDYGAAKVRLHATCPALEPVLQQVYRDYPLLQEVSAGPVEPAADSDAAFADYHVSIRHSPGLRRLWRPQARFLIDGLMPFEPFPARLALPLYEWGVNWSFGQRCNQHVLLHAGAVALEDRAVLMAAPPGHGKSTLTAALMLAGFRLLSDEFGVLDSDRAVLLPMLKPIALKNASIDLIEASAPGRLGPRFAGTRKGVVAHLPPDPIALQAGRRAARPAVVLFPAYRPGAALQAIPEERHEAFARLAFNSFNYPVLGATAFHALADLVNACACYRLVYGDVDQAVDWLRNTVQDAHEPMA